MVRYNAPRICMRCSYRIARESLNQGQPCCFGASRKLLACFSFSEARSAWIGMDDTGEDRIFGKTVAFA